MKFQQLFPALLSIVLCQCSFAPGSGVGISLDPQAGLCAVSQDGRYAACWNPLTKSYTLKARLSGNIVADLRYDSATKTWRAGLPGGSTAVYGAAGLVIEPPLPSLSGK